MNRGKVYLIGAGPGSPDLISVRGLRALRSADLVLVDRLLPPTVLSDLGIAADGEEKVIEWLGDKTPTWSQARINGWLVSQARRGRTVARLKGGDPFVFGQAEEETAYLCKWGISWEAIPGPSSFSAAATAAGFPLTRRNQGRSFAVVTARTAGGEVLARYPKADSLVILMGAAALESIVDTLVGDGWPLDTPATVIERGTLHWERRVESSLAQLADAARRARVASPACVLVGDAAVPLEATRHRPTVLFTGLDPTSFRDLGNLLHWPALELVPDRQSRLWFRRTLGENLAARFDGIVFTDKVGVAAFFEELDRRRLDARSLSGIRIAAVGLAAGRLGEHGLRADMVFEANDTERIREWGEDLARGRALLVEGTHPSRRLRESLEMHGVEASHLTLNRVIPNRQLGRTLPDHDVIYFVSPSGVRAYASAHGVAAFCKEVWCLGEDTQRVLAEHGVGASIVAADHQLASVDLVSA